MILSRLKGFQVLDQGLFVLRIEICTPEVPAVSISRQTGVEPEPCFLGFPACRNKTNAFGIIDIVPAIKELWASFRNLQEVTDGRHRTIVQIRRSGPDTIERYRDVAEGILELRVSPLVQIQTVKCIRCRLRP